MPDAPYDNTETIGLGKWRQGSNPGAQALNDNWEAIDAAVLALQSADAGEIVAREAADTAEASSRSSADSAEASARAAADSTLQGNITAEASTRATADTALAASVTAEASSRAAADSSEASTRASADTTLAGSVTTEATARAGADTTLQSNITAEAGTRAADDATEAAARAAEDALMLKKDGSRAMTGALDMGTHRINNVTDPSSGQDADTKAARDAAISAKASSATPASIGTAAAGSSGDFSKADHVHGDKISLGAIFDGQGAVITVPRFVDVYVPRAFAIESVVIMADQSGSATFDIRRDTLANFPPAGADSIVASAPPVLSSADHYSDSTLTGWSKSCAAGDVIRFYLSACTTCTKITIQVNGAKV